MIKSVDLITNLQDLGEGNLVADIRMVGLSTV